MQNEEAVKMIRSQPRLDQVLHMLDNAKELLDDQKHQNANNDKGMAHMSMQTEIRYEHFPT